MDTEVDDSVAEVLLSEVGAPALKRLSGIFLEECERNCAEIVGFLDTDDFSGAEIVAHRFKSTARQFGVFGLADVCQKLEKACTDQEAAQAAALTEILTANMPEVCRNLRKAAANAIENSQPG